MPSREFLFSDKHFVEAGKSKFAVKNTLHSQFPVPSTFLKAKKVKNRKLKRKH
jgi:hypothetical protein